MAVDGGGGYEKDRLERTMGWQLRHLVCLRLEAIAVYAPWPARTTIPREEHTLACVRQIVVQPTELVPRKRSLAVSFESGSGSTRYLI